MRWVFLPRVRPGRPVWAWATVMGLRLLLGGEPVSAQEPGTSADTPTASSATPAFRTVRANDLTNRYRFTEHYPREDDHELTGGLGPYRVSLVEVAREAVDQSQGTPRRSEQTREAVFVEQAREASGIGGVVGSVRFVERYRAKPDDPRRMMGARPLDGLTLALRYRTADRPDLVSLDGGPPTDYEAEVVAHQMAVAQLGLILPSTALRVGDTWRIARRGAQALLGDLTARGDTLQGTFVELRREENGPRMVALLRVAGRVAVESGEAAVNAEVQFTFQAPATGRATDSPPSTEAPAPPPSRGVEGVVEARGAVTEVRLAWTVAGPVPGPGRLRFQSTREVTMDRQFSLNAAPSLPKLPPASRPDDRAAWLVWIDPARRFRLEHPQDLIPPEHPQLAPAPPGSAVLVRSERGKTDLLQIDHVPQALTVDDLRAKLAAKTGLMRTKVTQGEEGWLPESEWRGRRVYRIEAAVSLPASNSNGVATPASRIHFDAYLIQTGQPASILAIATTSREPVAPIRREFEDCLQTIRLDPAPDLVRPSSGTNSGAGASSGP